VDRLARPMLGGLLGLNSAPTVHILMATHQGEHFIQAQLDSILAQTYPYWMLHVSDDGSSDDTVKRVKDFATQHFLEERIRFYRGPQLGVNQNFLYLVSQMGPYLQETNPQALFAFCDQDDFWLEDKIYRAVQAHLNEVQKDKPLLYASTTLICDEGLRPLRRSRLPQGDFIFEAALLQNVLSGNTMVMNGALLLLLQKVQPKHSVWYDWSAYQVVTACGGQVLFDPNPSLLYRQHGSNVIGAPERDLRAQGLRLKQLRKGRYKQRLSNNLLAAKDLWLDLQPVAKVACARLEEISSCRGALKRLWLAMRCGLRREGLFGRCAFFIACALGWV